MTSLREILELKSPRAPGKAIADADNGTAQPVVFVGAIALTPATWCPREAE